MGAEQIRTTGLDRGLASVEASLREWSTLFEESGKRIAQALELAAQSRDQLIAAKNSVVTGAAPFHPAWRRAQALFAIWSRRARRRPLPVAIAALGALTLIGGCLVAFAERRGRSTTIRESMLH